MLDNQKSNSGKHDFTVQEIFNKAQELHPDKNPVLEYSEAEWNEAKKALKQEQEQSFLPLLHIKRVWNWTGFGEKKLWDIIQLLLAPVLIAIAGYWLQDFTKQKEQAATENKINQETLTKYLDQMSELLQKNNLLKSKQDSEIFIIAQVKTVFALQSLDPIRQHLVIQFLEASKLNTFAEGKGLLANSLMSKAELNKADLSGANLLQTKLVGAKLEKANLTSAILTDADLTQASLNGADLTDANLTRADLTATNLEKAKLTRTNLFGAKFKRARLEETDLTGADLTGANLTEANLTRANLTSANFTRANLKRVNFPYANLADANLAGVDGRRANLTRADLTGANLTAANLSNADLTGANLTGANLTGADLTGANLTETNLLNADLTGANLTAADLLDAKLSGAILLGTNLSNVKAAFENKQLEKQDLPLLCKILLPQGISVNPNQDCESLPEVLLKRYPDIFRTIKKAQDYVNNFDSPK